MEENTQAYKIIRRLVTLTDAQESLNDLMSHPRIPVTISVQVNGDDFSHNFEFIRDEDSDDFNDNQVETLLDFLHDSIQENDMKVLVESAQDFITEIEYERT